MGCLLPHLKNNSEVGNGGGGGGRRRGLRFVGWGGGWLRFVGEGKEGGGLRFGGEGGGRWENGGGLKGLACELVAVSLPPYTLPSDHVLHPTSLFRGHPSITIQTTPP